MQLGYVTAERAPLVQGWYAAGRDVAAVFQGLSQTGAWVRVGLDGEMPTVDPEASSSLPTMRPAADRPIHDPDAFYPDPIYDDD